MRSPEERLLVACARGELDEAARAELQSALGAGVDWGSALAGAERHGLKPLLHRHLSSVPAVPRPVLVELWAAYEQGVRRNRAMAIELARILDALESTGIPALPYKGPSLACQAYGDVGMRDFCDLDILLRPRDLRRAASILESLGYEPAYPLTATAARALVRSPAQYHLVYRGPTAVVELHWKTDPDFPVERDDDAWWEALPRIDLLGSRVRAFALPDLLLVLCLHGSKHRWEALGWLTDIAEVLRRAEFDAPALAVKARQMRAERRFYLGLRLARDLLRAPIDARWAAGCERPDVATLARSVAREIFSPPGPGVWAALGRELALHEGVSRKARRTWQVAVSPSLVEWTRWPLPRPLFVLYPPLRVARLAAKHLIRFPRTPAAATPRTPPPQRHSTG